MAYYNECQYCGANLDPNEKCDCLEKETQQSELLKKNKQDNRDLREVQTV